MRNIMNLLNNNIITKRKFITFTFLLCLVTLPFKKLGFNNVATILFVLACIINYKDLKFTKNTLLFLPIFYFILCVCSLFWTIDMSSSLKAIPKEVGLFIFPLLFLFIKNFSQKEIHRIMLYFSYSMAIYCIYLLLNSLIKYLDVHDINVFFYHELVTLEVNAIYISVILAFAFLYLIVNHLKRWFDFASAILLFILIVLLSSKNIIIITVFLSILSFFLFKKRIQVKKLTLFIGLASILCVPFASKIIERFKAEFVDVDNNIIMEDGVENISIKNAWIQEDFSKNSYFTGTSIRVYQLRLLVEFIQETPVVFFSGMGINATQEKIRAKQQERGYLEYFGNLNFHNQFLQSHAELGILGLIILLSMLGSSFYIAIKNRDYNFFCFAVLMSSLCITESIFSRNRGVMIFILFYSLYHQLYIKKISDKKFK